MSPFGSLLLFAHATLAAGTAWIGPPPTHDAPVELEGASGEGVDPGAPADGSKGPNPEDPTPAEPAPDFDPLIHLDRAQALAAAGDLTSAEAEVSVAISLAPQEAAAYLERAQIRVALAEQSGREDAAQRRVHAELLRLAATDVSAYLELAALEPEGRTWFEARRDALLREADALDPPVVVQREPEPTEDQTQTTTPVTTPSGHDDHVRRPGRRSVALLSMGALTGATGVALATASLQIEQHCPPGEPCTASWRARPSLLAPAVVLAGASSAAVVLALAEAPSLDRRHVRAGVIGTTMALGSAAVVFGTLTGALAASRWGSLSPSNDHALGTVQTLGNTSVASFTAALPLLSAGVTAWLRGRWSQRTADRATARRQSP